MLDFPVKRQKNNLISNKNKQKRDHKIRVQDRLVASSQSKSYEFSRISSDTTAVREEAHDSNSKKIQCSHVYFGNKVHSFKRLGLFR